ncbi:MAG: hypothetical protein FWF24_06445 [Alphaproteobacteria bacterium]|nr:hypothetical protein [Alphaproteobacteria bacterium]
MKTSPDMPSILPVMARYPLLRYRWHALWFALALLLVAAGFVIGVVSTRKGERVVMEASARLDTRDGIALSGPAPPEQEGEALIRATKAQAVAPDKPQRKKPAFFLRVSDSAAGAQKALVHADS